MEIIISCTRRPNQKIKADIWPWYEVGEKISCPLQIVGVGFVCMGCMPGYFPVVKEVSNTEKTLLLDPPSTTPPWTEL